MSSLNLSACRKCVIVFILFLVFCLYYQNHSVFTTISSRADPPWQTNNQPEVKIPPGKPTIKSGIGTGTTMDPLLVEELNNQKNKPRIDKDPYQPAAGQVRRYIPRLLNPGFSQGLFLGGIPYPSKFENLQLLYCGISKNAFSQFRALFCRSKEEPKARVLVNPFRAHYDKTCIGDVEVQLTNDPIDKETRFLWRNQSWHKVAVIRDPVDRFVSGFIDKIMKHKNENCYECPTNFYLNNFVAENYLTMKYHSSQNRVIITKVQRVNHFFPQYWSCDFQTHLRQYDLLVYNKTEDFKIHARNKAVQWGVRKEIVFGGWGADKNLAFLEVPTSHASDAATTTALRDKLVGNLTMFNTFFKTYSIDYYHLNFKLPPEAAGLCEGVADQLKLDICLYQKYGKSIYDQSNSDER